MAGEKQPEIGIRNPYQARYGITIPGCKGWRNDQDRSTLKDEELYSAINVRVIDGIVVCRPGQSAAVNAGHATTGCVQGVVDINGGGPRFVLAMQRSDTLSGLADIDVFDRQLNPPYQRVTAPPTHQRIANPPIQGNSQNSSTIDDSRPRFAYCWWNDEIVFADVNHKLNRLIFPDENLDIDEIQADPLLDLRVGSTQFDVASMCTLAETTPSSGSEAQNPKLGPPLYFGTVNGGVFGWINGEMKQLLAEGTFSTRVIVFRYNDRLYACGTNSLQVQTGWANGGDPASTTWTTVSMPGGISNFVPACAIEYSKYGYIGGQDTGSAAPKGRILRIDDLGGTPTATIGDDGTGNKLIAVDDLALALGGLYAAFRYKPSATELANFAVVSESGATGSPVASPPWSEQGMVPRLLGVSDGIYMTGWSSGSGPSGNAESSLYGYDGTTLSKLSDISDFTGNNYAPFDMVAF